MAKRRLTDQQRCRIAHKQRTLLDEPLGTEQEGLVIAHFGRQLSIEDENGAIFRCFSRQNLGSLVTGDSVLFQPHLTQTGTGLILARQPRHSVLVRPDPYKQQRDIVANIDQLLLVIAIEPEPITYYIDQYLMVAQIIGIPCHLVINKNDLPTTPAIKTIYELYQSIGYTVLSTSAERESGLDELTAILSRQNSILVGQSGVGKSTLLNQLVPNAQAKQGEISSANQKGKHTTTTAQLYHLPHGGNLIDSPGVREFGIWHIAEAERARCFVEFLPKLGHCRFRDCNHLDAPGCAIRAAVDQGEISSQRYQNYQRLMAQAKHG